MPVPSLSFSDSSPDAVVSPETAADPTFFVSSSLLSSEHEQRVSAAVTASSIDINFLSIFSFLNVIYCHGYYILFTLIFQVVATIINKLFTLIENMLTFPKNSLTKARLGVILTIWL